MTQTQVVEIVFETHSISEDNERGVASGWNHSRLSERGRDAARDLGSRRRDDGLAAVFTSDLYRAVETANVAFGDSPLLILHDWRLRECNYGAMNGRPVEKVHSDRQRFLDVPYPAGESWRGAVARVGRFFEDLPLRWSNERVLLIGHVATRWACDHLLKGIPLEELATEEFAWQEGWEYRLEP